jgi:hypothetical protein
MNAAGSWFVYINHYHDIGVIFILPLLFFKKKMPSGGD